MKDTIKVRGFFRLQVTQKEGDKEFVVGDSGWRKNTVVNLGFQDYIVGSIGGITGSKQVGYVALGTGGAPASTDTSLAGEISGSTKRKATTNTAVSSKTLRCVAAFNSTDSFLTASSNLSNIGLFNTTNTDATLLAGNTYTSSTVATNQNVNVTYELRFS